MTSLVRYGTPVLLALLAGCARQSDGFKPKILITSPSEGSISRTGITRVQGYAYDNDGITSLRVNGQELLDTPALRDERGKKIVRFEFKTQGGRGQIAYRLEARDALGSTATKELPLRVDVKPPVIELTRVELEDGTLRVVGTVTDNVKVNTVSVNGVQLNVPAAARVPFYAEVSGSSATVTAVDAAGNKATRTARP
ncbi:hypothetical protein HNR42_000871 [Deinobacterium chartae]|uniref:Uncharacterized protein n=1 Tax=Deinobacterium chartae TaxID=521158 RepID=A0A841HXS5_9DEIO|nr:hypothetical protein [Deinobacterium chartae]MBB6097454.1 hypothetical protein [Deinobacterium chartae]